MFVSLIVFTCDRLIRRAVVRISPNQFLGFRSVFVVLLRNSSTPTYPLADFFDRSDIWRIPKQPLYELYHTRNAVASIQQKVHILSLYRLVAKMDSNCNQCSGAIKTIELVQCGYCHQSAHLKCVGLKRPSMEVVNENRNILWFCDQCMIRIEYLSNNPIQSTQEVVEAVSNAFRDTFDELKVEIKETKELAKSLAERQTSNDPSGIERGRTAWPSIKRSRDIAEKSTPKSRPDSKLIGGTKEIENGHLTVETVAKPPEKFWLYLSRIARHVTEDDVSELVKNAFKPSSLLMCGSLCVRTPI